MKKKDFMRACRKGQKMPNIFWDIHTKEYKEWFKRRNASMEYIQTMLISFMVIVACMVLFLMASQL